MKFPLKSFGGGAAYWSAYIHEVATAAQAVDPTSVERAATLLADVFEAGRTLYVCGNGGSAAICNHLLCDFAKGIQTDTIIKPRVVSLSAHLEMITAIGNDFSFEEIFAYQLQTFGRPGDAVLTISASGNSENIVRALEWARNNRLASIALTGFEGGRSAKLADFNIHVPAHNYGVVEDVHQSIMHVFAQYLRMRSMDAELIATRSF